MHIYALYQPEDTSLDVVAVKEGFNWIGFLFFPIWAAWHQLWIWAVGFVLGSIFLDWFCKLFFDDLFLQCIVFVGFFLIFGWTANDINRSRLIKKGFQERVFLLANNKKIAVWRYFLLISQGPDKPRNNRAGGPW